MKRLNLKPKPAILVPTRTPEHRLNMPERPDLFCTTIMFNFIDLMILRKLTI